MGGGDGGSPPMPRFWGSDDCTEEFLFSFPVSIKWYRLFSIEYWPKENVKEIGSYSGQVKMTKQLTQEAINTIETEQI